MKLYITAGSDATFNYDFQIRLSEGTNVIEFIYNKTAAPTNSYNIQIGLRGTSNSDFKNITGSTWSNPSAGGVNTSTMTLSSSANPSSGQIYRWTPPANKLTPTITFNSITKTMGDSSFTISASSDSSGAFTYTSGNTSVATISGSTVYIVGAGTSIITANQASTATYNSGSATATLTVNKGTPTITLANMNKTNDDDDFTVPTTSNSTGIFTYTSSDLTVATISGSTITIVGAGTTTITANQAASTNYEPGSKSATLTVKLNTIIYCPNIRKLLGDPKFTIPLISNRNDPIVYSSSNTSVATIDSNTGEITIVSTGSTSITATQAAVGDYVSASVSATLTVGSTYTNSVQDYTLSIISDSYTAITDATNALGTTTGTSIDDTVSSSLTIPFTFNFNGVNYTSLFVNPNGYISLGGSISTKSLPISSTSNGQIIAVLARDLKGRDTNALVSYVTQGTSPNRVFVVEYKKMTAYYFSPPAPQMDYNFQIRLYEGTNIVETVYGKTTDPASLTTYPVQAGLRGTSNTDFNIVRAGTWSSPLAGTLNDHIMNITRKNNPLSGLIYRWTPPVAKSNAIIYYPNMKKTVGDPNFYIPISSNSDGAYSYSSSNTSVATINSTTGEITIYGVGSTTITVSQTSTSSYYPASVSSTLTIAATYTRSVLDYSFASTTGTYTDLSGSTNALSGTFGSTIDAQSNFYNNLPFMFNFNDNYYTNIYVNANGFISFGSHSNPTEITLPISDAPSGCVILSPFGANLFGATASSLVSVGIQGTAPNRMFIIEYRNMSVYPSSNSLLYDFQIRLYETTNVIEFIYKQISAPSSNVNVQIGLRDTLSSNFKNIKSGTWEYPLSGTSNTDVMTLTTTSYPETGRVYRWTPPKTNPTITKPADIIKSSVDASFSLTAPTSNSSGAFSYTSSNTGVATISGSTVTIGGVGSTTITATQAETETYTTRSTTFTLTVIFTTIANYNFLATTSTYTEITGTNAFGDTTGTSINDQTTGATPISIFSFTFDGSIYNTINVNANGFVTFGSSSTMTNIISNPLSSTAVSNVVAPFGRNLIGTESSSVLYTTQGSSPNRVFVIQYKDFTTSDGTGTKIVLSFQILLYETTNIINFIYKVTTPQNITGSLSCQVGLKGVTTSYFKIITNATTDWNTPSIGTAISNTMTLTNDKQPPLASNLLYRWFPPGVTIDPTITTPSNINKTYGDASFDLTAPTSNSSGSFSYTSSNTGVATISGSTVTIGGVGSTTITATQASTATYNEGSTTFTITVAKANPTITLSNIGKKATDAPFSLDVGTNNLDGGLSYTSSDIEVATVDSNTGVVTIFATGTTNITVTQAETPVYNSGSITAKLAVFDINIYVTSTTCNGSSDGEIQLILTGGTSPYNYTWSNSAITPYITVVSAGEYWVDISDSNGCTLERQTITVTQPSALSVDSTITNVSTNGGSDGSISLSVSGGTSPYNYLWSNGATGDSINNLTAGTYNVNVTDSNLCTIYQEFTVTQPSISKTPTTINLPDINVTVGDPNFNLNTYIVTNNTEGMRSYLFLGDPSVASVNPSTGDVTIVGVGSGQIQVSILESTNYQEGIGSATLTVSPSGGGGGGSLLEQTITFETFPIYQLGTTSIITLTATASSGLPVSYTSTNTAVATVSGNVITIISAGETNIQANQSGNATYNPAPQVSRSLVIMSKTSSASVGSEPMYLWNNTSNLDPVGAIGTGQIGRSVSINAAGDCLVAGAPYDNSNDVGCAYIYRLNNQGVWTQEAKLVGSGATGFARQGSAVSISRDGNTVAIGGPYDDNYTGAVWIFNYNGTSWSQVGNKLVPTGITTNSQAGTSVSLNSDGTIFAVGMPSYNSNKGAVARFKLTNGTWGQLGSTIFYEGNTHTWFGNSVCLNAIGDRMTVGANRYNNNNGLVRIYQFNNADYSIMGDDIVGESAEFQGGSVSLNDVGDRVAIGCAKYSSAKGRVKIYGWANSTWSLLGNSINGTITNGQFGYSLCLNASGDRVVIGNYGINFIMAYEYNGTSWIQTGRTIQGQRGEKLEWSVSLNAGGNVIVGGAPFYSSNVGRVRVYQRAYNPNGSANVSAGSSNPLVNSLTVTPITTTYNSSGYGVYTGYTQVLTRVSITALDSSGNYITNHSTSPIKVTFFLPNVLPNAVIKFYKIDPNNNYQKFDENQYPPVQLTYVGDYNWTATLTSLSEYIVQGENPCEGEACGDPHVKRVDGTVSTLPNSWKRVLLYDNGTTRVIGKCAFILDEVIDGLHLLDITNRRQKKVIKIDRNVHLYVKDLTYFVELEVYWNSELSLKIDTINGKIVFDNKRYLVDNVFNNKSGIYSITNKYRYPPKHFVSYCVYLENGDYLLVSVDNFWDDINNIDLYLNGTKTNEYKGEFFVHSVAHALEIIE